MRATVPQKQATRAFMQLSAAKDTKLVGQAPANAHCAVHEMAMQDNAMRLRQLRAVELPAGKAADLKQHLWRPRGPNFVGGVFSAIKS